MRTFLSALISTLLVAVVLITAIVFLGRTATVAALVTRSPNPIVTHTVTVRLTGSGPTALLSTADASLALVDLPFEDTVVLPGDTRFHVSAFPADFAQDVTCQIAVDGHVLTARTSSEASNYIATCAVTLD